MILQSDFNEITQLIAAAKQRAAQAVNVALIDLYSQVAQTIGCKIAQAEWGDGVVAQLAEYLARTQLGLRGFTRSNLFRMKQFYEAYQGKEIVSAVLRQFPWAHNLTILSKRNKNASRLLRAMR